MADDNFLGEIILTPYNFAPRGYALCDGRLLPINQNQALFSLLGTTYGGDGIRTFGLPDLRSRIAVGSGQGPGLSFYQVGELTGVESVSLLFFELPAHRHAANAVSSSGTTATPSDTTYWAASSKLDGTYQDSSPDRNLSVLGVTGTGSPHENRPPLLALNYCIALTGIFPPRG